MLNELVFAPTTKHIKLDSFPITLYKGVAGGEGNVVLFEETRLIVTNDYIYAILMGDTGPYFALQEELVEFEYIPKVGYQINGANLDYLGVTSGSCGCGSRLRGMRLLPGVGHINIYKSKK